jgi:hypothetical protein
MTLATTSELLRIEGALAADGLHAYSGDGGARQAGRRLCIRAASSGLRIGGGAFNVLCEGTSEEEACVSQRGTLLDAKIRRIFFPYAFV